MQSALHVEPHGEPGGRGEFHMHVLPASDAAVRLVAEHCTAAARADTAPAAVTIRVSQFIAFPLRTRTCGRPSPTLP